MSVRCRMFGHRVSEFRKQRDANTFILHSECQRCGAPMIRAINGWQVSGENSAAAA